MSNLYYTPSELDVGVKFKYLDKASGKFIYGTIIDPGGLNRPIHFKINFTNDPHDPHNFFYLYSFFSNNLIKPTKQELVLYFND